MNAPYIITRRRLLKSIASAGAVSAAGTFEGLGLSAALAQTAPTDYKALVCVFLFGGNDANNLIVPMETAEYNLYSTGRGGSTNGGIAIPSDQLLGIRPKTLNKAYGLHPSMGPLKTLFDAGKMAAVTNIGTLAEPMTKAEYTAASKLRPEQLFSHSDQQMQWQTSVSRGIERTGWGGRLADVVGPTNGSNFPMVTSVAGSALYINGNTPRVVVIPQSGTFGLSTFGSATDTTNRVNAMKNMMNLPAGNDFVMEADDVIAQALGASDLLNPIISVNTSPVNTHFTGINTGIGNQLRQVAKLIEARAAIGLKRQIFFVSIGGFDTHTNQITAHNNLYGQLAPALKAFYDATVALGVANQVTTFTMSDFGRTLKQASGGGSDHGWGSHQLVIGGAVRGQEFYGQFPNQTLGGPSDLSTNGRWIPTTSVDQYGATLAKWFGVSASDMSTVFPNIRRFSNTDLGFLA
ncbi:MAG: DUF1501 domain-containing protein [Nitrosomonadaceae bacterium]|jgi:uncharacterized protein (DUF1501 family)|nr:DUF1501 domain-containing protein [Nitrosomonadaceae bacterium]